MKRVLIFSLTYHPYIGGAEVAIQEITDRVDSAQYAFDMVTLRFDDALPAVEKVGNVTVYRIGPTASRVHVSDRSLPLKLRFAKALFPIIAIFKAATLHRTYPYDAVWAMMANPAGFAALLFSYLYPHVPYVLELQDGRAVADMPKRRPILRIIWWLYVRMYTRAQRLKAISHFIEREARTLGYTGPIAVIPNAVDVEKFSRPISEEEVAALKQKYDKKMGDVFLFTASRLVLSRGVEDTIRALTYLPPHVRLLIAGAGEGRALLEKLSTDIGVSERVIFAGHVPHADLPTYYRMSDIFVRASIIEGFGNSFVEAFAAGVPVVATPVGGIPDFLTDPDTDPDMEPTGLFCAVHNPESVARAVERYMKDPALVARVRKNAQELVAQKYDWNNIARRMVKEVFEPLTALR